SKQAQRQLNSNSKNNNSNIQQQNSNIQRKKAANQSKTESVRLFEVEEIRLRANKNVSMVVAFLM
ncbi:hypothetical protein, partial [Thiolapillus sp.]|uniref:hypothetical protein n=1 Tax=Thiolapillus sp. TaxID=2017437 RepID=UPI003AF7E814